MNVILDGIVIIIRDESWILDRLLSLYSSSAKKLFFSLSLWPPSHRTASNGCPSLLPLPSRGRIPSLLVPPSTALISTEQTRTTRERNIYSEPQQQSKAKAKRRALNSSTCSTFSLVSLLPHHATTIHAFTNKHATVCVSSTHTQLEIYLNIFYLVSFIIYKIKINDTHTRVFYFIIMYIYARMDVMSPGR